MNRKFLFFLFSLFVLTVSVSAQDEDLQSSVDYKVHKMKISLKLTDGQASAVEPIIKNYMVKRGAFLQEVAGEGIVDHVSVKSALRALKENEYKELAKILSEDQMKEWINKENLMATLNPDSAESSVDGDATIGMDGANFKF